MYVAAKKWLLYIISDVFTATTLSKFHYISKMKMLKGGDKLKKEVYVMFLNLSNWEKYSVSDLKNLLEVVEKTIIFPVDTPNITKLNFSKMEEYYLFLGFMKGFISSEVVGELAFIYDKRINLSSKKYIKRRISELERLKSSYCEKCSYEKEKKDLDLMCFSGKTSACCLGCYEKCDYRCSFSAKQFKSKGYEVISNNLVKISISIDREKLEELVYFAGDLSDDDILDDKIVTIINNSIAKTLSELKNSEGVK